MVMVEKGPQKEMMTRRVVQCSINPVRGLMPTVPRRIAGVEMRENGAGLESGIMGGKGDERRGGYSKDMG